MNPSSDRATTHDLGGAIRSILPSLEQFVRFEGNDPARVRSPWRAALDTRLPLAGVGRDAVLADLADLVVANGLRVGHPGFSGWVTTMPTDVGAAADLAQAVAVPQRWWATAGNFVDDLAIRWLTELLGFPAGFGGTFTGGGSTANLIGMGAARQHAGERLGLHPSRDGNDGMVEPRVYCSTETHHVVGRALGVLGLGRRSLREIPLDRTGTIDVNLLQAALDEDAAAGRTQVAIVACAGDVNTGRVDPIAELARIAGERGIWLHVDGAYGGWGVLDERVRERFGDLATYDSFAIDPHKWLAAPVGTGQLSYGTPACWDVRSKSRPGPMTGSGTPPLGLKTPVRHSTSQVWGHQTSGSTSPRQRGVWLSGQYCAKSGRMGSRRGSYVTTTAPASSHSGHAPTIDWNCLLSRFSASAASVIDP